MDAQQELFTKLIQTIKALGYSVYDGELPPEGTPYPFVYLGDNTQSDKANKSAVFGTIYQTIHVWHNTPTKRGTVSNMLLSIKMACRAIEKTDNFSLMLTNQSQRIITDKTTKTPLLHGILDVEFKFS